MASSHPISTVKSPRHRNRTLRQSSDPSKLLDAAASFSTAAAGSSQSRIIRLHRPPARIIPGENAEQTAVEVAEAPFHSHRWPPSPRRSSTLSSSRLDAKLSSILRNGTKLFAVGTASSLIGTSPINALIIAKKAVGKSGEVENVPILSTSVGYGVFMIVSSNLRTAVFGEYICRGRVANTSKRVS
ncbi:Protein RETICULATA-RELATED 4, chloroplastic [Linum perenne]